MSKSRIKIIISMPNDFRYEAFREELSSYGNSVGFDPYKLVKKHKGYTTKMAIRDYLITLFNNDYDKVHSIYLAFDGFTLKKIKLQTGQKCWENMRVYRNVVKKIVGIWNHVVDIEITH